MNPEASHDELVALAKEGDPTAQFYLGEFYRNKNGVGSITLAASWFLKAANQEYAPAQLALAHLYLSGLEPELYERDARYWLQKAAQNGCQESARILKESGTEEQLVDICDVVIEADAGNPQAQFELGCTILFGQGPRRSASEGLSWIYKAAVAGHAKAQAHIGAFHLFGEHLEGNGDEAFKWLWLAAQQYESSALYYLGFCFHEGIGVNRNDYRAAHYLLKSALLGNRDAQFHLARFYYEGIGFNANIEQAQSWCQASALQGHGEARIMLKQLYLS
jgi:TPR repeat protein